MPTASFRFYEELNDFLPPQRRKVGFELQFDGYASVKAMITALGVPCPEVELILVNGRSVGFDHVVRDGDRIAVYPVFESFDVSAQIELRSEPLRKTRFVVDTQLATLAYYLRLCGFDTLSCQYAGNAELVRLSVDEARLLLTRDPRVLKHRYVTRGYFVRNERPRRQLAEVLSRFQLQGAAEPVTRCPWCNGLLRAIEEEVWRICSECERLYRKGHHRRIQRLLEGPECDRGESVDLG